MFRRVRRTVLVGVIALSGVLAGPAVRASTDTSIVQFNGGAAGSNGVGPAAGLVFDKEGNLYGTTLISGEIFKLTPPAAGQTAWTAGVIYAGDPQGTLALGPEGGLYGVNAAEGVFQYGDVFRLTPPAAGGTTWEETDLYDFLYQAAPRQQDGGTPVAGVILDASGNIYGTTELGGYYTRTLYGTGFGTVFKLTPPTFVGGRWTESVLHRFSGTADGTYPVASLIMDQKGALYGTAELGGNTDCDNQGCGVVFRLNPPVAGATAWTTSVLHRFAYAAGPGADGRYPVAALVAGPDGVLYGTTQKGGAADLGIVFALTPPASGQGAWTETILHSFTGVPDGAFPYASLLLGANGVLTGTTANGGTSNWGTVFTLTPPAQKGGAWTENVLYRFEGAPNADGAYPKAQVISDTSGNLYSTTFAGGPVRRNTCVAGCGTVFELTP